MSKDDFVGRVIFTSYKLSPEQHISIPKKWLRFRGLGQPYDFFMRDSKLVLTLSKVVSCTEKLVAFTILRYVN